MKLKATRNGTWPKSVHWHTGDVYDINVEKGVEIPKWLVEVKPRKKASKKADAEG